MSEKTFAPHASVHLSLDTCHFPGLWCNRSISPCEGDGPGANPGFLTNFDGPKLAGYRPKKGVVAHRERAAGREFGVAGSIPACETLSAAALVHRALSNGNERLRAHQPASGVSIEFMRAPEFP